MASGGRSQREQTEVVLGDRARTVRRLPPLPAAAALTGIAAHVAAHCTELSDAAA
jgi:hypothetical protein